MSVEALLGTDRAFAADLQALRPHPGQARQRPNLRRLLAGSEIVASHRYGDPRVQDAYSLRCTPQVHGAARDTLDHADARRRRSSSSSAIDNPMILPDGRVESCGNFHGAPLGFACDFLAIAVAEVGAIAERRTDRLLDATRSHGLPPFLTADAGRQLRHDDRAVHAGGDGGREPPPGGARERRHAAHQRDAGGPRLDGAGARRASSAARSRTWRGSSPSSSPARRAASTCARRCDRQPATAAALAALRAARPRPGPGPLRWRRSSPRPSSSCGGGELLRATEAVAGALE